MRKFRMKPKPGTQQDMTESLYYAKVRFDLNNYKVLEYLGTHLSKHEPYELLSGYLSETHVQQLMRIKKEVKNYSGGYNTLPIRSMIEALCVDGGVSKQVNADVQMISINWDEISGKYSDLDSDNLRKEYARIRTISRNNSDNEFNLIIKQNLINELNI